MKNKKVLKAVLAGAMALGVVGTATVAEIPGLSQEASAAVLETKVDIYGVWGNTVDHSLKWVTDSSGHDGRIASYKITNSSGTIVAQGTDTLHLAQLSGGQYTWYTTVVNTYVPGGPGTNYKITWQITAGTTTYTASANFVTN